MLESGLLKVAVPVTRTAIYESTTEALALLQLFNFTLGVARIRHMQFHYGFLSFEEEDRKR